MATTQYIGARYVPKFAEPVEWSSGRAFEPLTIVTYQGNSFTSKKPVPANIGNPASNPSYWASTGIYNQQVEAYRQEVQAVQASLDDVNDDIADIRDKIIPVNRFKGRVTLGFGDSNMQVNPPYGNIYNNICSMLQCENHNKGISNATYQTISGHPKIIDQITAENEVVAADVALVVFIGGINDFHYGEWNLSNYGNEFVATVNAAITKYPNAEILVAFDSGSQHANRRLLSMQWYTARRCGTLSNPKVVQYCSLADMCLDSSYWYNQNHYSVYGSSIAALRMVSCLFGFGETGGVTTFAESKTISTPQEGTVGITGIKYLHRTTIDPYTFIRHDYTRIYWTKDSLSGPETISSYQHLLHFPGETLANYYTSGMLTEVTADGSGAVNRCLPIGLTVGNYSGSETSGMDSPVLALRTVAGGTTLAQLNSGQFCIDINNVITPAGW